MPTASTVVVFAGAALALLLVPGPSVLYIVTRSVDQGRAAGVVSVLGIHCGTFVHIAAAAAGLSTLLASSAAAFTTVKYLGAAYLVYLGIMKLRERPGRELTVVVTRQPLRRIFVQGVVVNVLNPKTALFFLAFLPQFVDPARGSAPPQIVLLGLVFVALGLLSDSGYALAAAAAGRFFRGHGRFATWQHRVSGGVYITLGAAAAFAGGHARQTH